MTAKKTADAKATIIDLTPSEKRQAWLENAVKAARPLFVQAGQSLPEKLRISAGWSTSGRRAIGSCYRESASGDAHREIFISPVIETSSKILGTVVHELCHAALPDNIKHGKEFVALGHAVGLIGKPTQLGEGGAAFQWFIDNFVKEHGEFPAAAINDKGRAGKQETAMLKVACQECGYTVRTTKKWLAYGTPLCPCNEEPMVCC